MPFAPITIKKYLKKMYKNLDSKIMAVKYMTATAKCTMEAYKKSPAAVHVDSTARPQIISKYDNLKIYNILNEYFKISKIQI